MLLKKVYTYTVQQVQLFAAPPVASFFLLVGFVTLLGMELEYKLRKIIWRMCVVHMAFVEWRRLHRVCLHTQNRTYSGIR